ncbi:MAG: hypothetical protein U0930_03790 [Pirellulales bacterium]
MLPQQQPTIRSTTESDLPIARRYIALTIVRYALIVLAVLEGLGWLIMSVIMLIALAATSKAETAGASATIALLYVAGTFFGGAIVCCLLVAASELIKLAMDIQSNTLATARRRS